jgi:hypothetical protein
MRIVKNQICQACNMHERIRNAHNISVGKWGRKFRFYRRIILKYILNK